jgi:hypothetical protein
LILGSREKGLSSETDRVAGEISEAVDLPQNTRWKLGRRLFIVAHGIPWFTAVTPHVSLVGVLDTGCLPEFEYLPYYPFLSVFKW